MSRKWSTLVLLLLVTPWLALAQNTGKLSGRVLDATTNEPLPGANVVLEGTQLGTITDVEGNYFIIGVPVGTFDVRASFVGYQAQIQTGVEINAGYTRELNFSLSPGVELTEVVVEYERPLIQKDAIGAPRVVGGDEIVNMPVRGVASVAALQSGVVSTEGSTSLYVRGGRSEEVAYYVDGVKVVGALAVPQQSIQEQEMLMGSIPARYGDAMSGIISVTTKGGVAPKFFGTVEALSSQVLDPFGYNLGSVSLGGPIVQNKAGFFLSAEGVSISDNDPFAVQTLQLNDDVFAQLQGSPMAIRAENADGDLVWVPLPGDISAGLSGTAADSVSLEHVEALMTERGLIGGETGLELTGDYRPSFQMNRFGPDQFKKNSDKDNPYRRLSLNGNVTIAPFKSVNVRLGGAFDQNTEDTYNFNRSLYDRDRYYNVDRQTWRGFANWRQYLSSSTFYELNVNYTDYQGYQYPQGFSNEVEDALFYGDADGMIIGASDTTFTKAYDINSAVRNYWEWNPDDDVFVRTYRDGDFPGASAIYSLFSAPGSLLQRYIKFHTQQLRLNASATTQIGLHQIEFGGEFEQRTLRNYDITSGRLARLFNDGNVETTPTRDGQPVSVSSWSDLPFKEVEAQLVSGNWYGYNYLGNNQPSDDNLEEYVAHMLYGKAQSDLAANALNVAPNKPMYYAGYVQDKIEFRDLIINLGVRVDVFDNNTQVLKDPYAAVPLVRADIVTNRPDNIGSDFAVYFPDGDATKAPVGYRDQEGNFFDADGHGSEFDDISKLGTVSEVQTTGTPNERARQFISAVFEDYKPQVSVMPRIGVSFPVTDQALFFASYNVLTQRPSERAFVSPQTYIGMGNELIANPKLKPETTTQYELGFRQRLGARAALQLSGFYRTQNNKIQTRTLIAGYPVHQSYFNVDYTTTKGATVEFDLRRTNNVSLNANYTYQYAQGTGSDSETQDQIAWRGDYYPEFISPTSFDRRHTFNLRIDYRLGEGEGPQVLGAYPLANFGVNLIGQVMSGLPYTQLKTPLTYPIYQDATDPAVGGINAAYMPWSSLLNLNIDRQFDLGGSTVTAFLQVQNLLDQDNIIGVYRGSGLPDDDGYLTTKTGQDQIANSEDPESFAFHYRTFLRNPLGAAETGFSGDRAFGVPRRTRLGVRLTF